jgi:hypothetical protein
VAIENLLEMELVGNISMVAFPLPPLPRDTQGESFSDILHLKFHSQY